MKSVLYAPQIMTMMGIMLVMIAMILICLSIHELQRCVTGKITTVMEK